MKPLRILLIIAIVCFISTLNINAQWTPGETYDLSQEVVSEKKLLWKTYNASNTTWVNEFRGYHHILASYKNVTYIIYIDKELRPKVVKVYDDGASEEYYLEDENYKIPSKGGDDIADTHHFFTIGVDEQGYIHIFGDMHNYPEANTDHMADEYKNGKCMYWRSNNTEDISAFTWHGESFGQCPYGSSFTYSQLFNDNKGKLYYSARVRSSTERGFAAVNFNRYNSDTKEWKLIGGTNAEFENDCLFYEDNGEDGGTYSKPCRNVHFDLNNKAHFTASLYNSNRPKPIGDNGKYNTDLVYAQSDDMGVTFTKANGSLIDSLPMRIDNPDQQPDLIITDSIVNATTSHCVTDYQGRPYVITSVMTEIPEISESFACYGYDEANNTWEDLSHLRTQNRGYMLSDRAGVITNIERGTKKIERFFKFDSVQSYGIDILDMCIDRRHLMETGNIRGIPKRTIGTNQPFELYEITIERPVGVDYPAFSHIKSTYSKLHSLTADVGYLKKDFISEDYEYDLIVNESISEVNFTVIAKHNATISGDFNITTIPDTATITVTAEDGVTTQDYVIYILRNDPTEAFLEDLRVDGISVDNFSADNFTYSVEVPFGTASVNIDATNADPYASIAGTGTFSSLPGTAEIVVSSEDSSNNNTYYIEFTEGPSYIATLSDLSIDGTTIEGFGPDKTIYDLGVAPGTTSVEVTATTTDINATFTGGGTFIYIPGPAIVTVLAEDGITQLKYTVNITFSTSYTRKQTIEKLNIYPNPVKNKIEFQGNIDKLKSCTILDYSGKTIKNSLPVSGSINVEDLKPSIYILKLNFESHIQTIKFIKID